MQNKEEGKRPLLNGKDGWETDLGQGWGGGGGDAQAADTGRVRALPGRVLRAEKFLVYPPQ